MTRPVNGRESIEVETVSFNSLINEIKPNNKTMILPIYDNQGSGEP